jgi:hypothetical protein
MASHFGDDVLEEKDRLDTHVSANGRRRQESTSHAWQGAREADGRQGSEELANFLNSSRVEPPKPSTAGIPGKHKPIMVAGNVYNGGGTLHGEGISKGKSVSDSCSELEVKCGPLLNFRRMENETWFGSVLIVTKGGGVGGGPEPQLIWKTVGGRPAVGAGPRQGVSAEEGGNANGTTNGISASEKAKVVGTKLYSDPSNTFWRFDLQVPMQQSEIECEYSIPGVSFTQGTKTDKQSFFIPAISDSMRIMFYSCNGFSVGTDEDAWSGAALWNDVLRVHQKTPFHVM